MQKPCNECPFLKNSILSKTMEPNQKAKIVKSITEHDAPFLCHKTYHKAKEKQTICIGSALILEKEKGVMSNYAYRMHSLFGKLKIAKLDLSAPIFECFKDFIKLK